MSSNDETFLESAIESISSSLPYELRRHLEHLRFLDDATGYVLSPFLSTFSSPTFFFSSESSGKYHPNGCACIESLESFYLQSIIMYLLK
jgi:hypothetical protein